MSKSVYEIPVNGDDSGEPLNFPPPARGARPRTLTTAPPPSGDYPAAPTYAGTPEAPFTSPPPSMAPDGGSWPAPTSTSAPAPAAQESAVNNPPQIEPSIPGFTPAPPAPDLAFSATEPSVAFPAPEQEMNFPPPTADSLNYAERMFALDGVSETLATADPELIGALSEVLFLNASDLHVAANTAPMFRIDGALGPQSITTPWSREKVKTALRSILTDAQQARFDEELELDIAYTISANARFRVNMYQQRGAIGAAFRLIPTEIKSLVDLGVPESISRFASLPRGLVLVTGPTGSGKSTTLAALIDLVNKTRADHIMTVEDPIEFMHGNQKALVNQREVGEDTHSFAAALKHVLRQDPDVILIGELRDLETISIALTAAETGHLVFATLHTQDAPQTIDRIIDVFPPHQQGQVRAQLAATLRGVVCQTLVKKASGKGRIVATEVLIATPAVANLIREGKTFQIASAMQAGGELGMHTMDRHLADLANAGIITQRAAIDKAQDVEGLRQMIHRVEAPATPSAIDFNDSYSVGAAH